ncbi:MAG: hypothetical protein ABIQ02_03535, partial [Saprospiraceae bacterium]
GSMYISLRDVSGKLIRTEEWNYSSGPSTLELTSDQLPSGIILVLLQDRSERIILKAVHQ